MKIINIITFIIIIIFSTCKLNAQIKVVGIDRQLLKIARGQIEIPYGASENVIIQKLGSPNSNKVFVYEMENATGKELTYSDARFLLLENKIKHFAFNTSSVSILYDGVSIKIGDSINFLNNFFPSYQNFPCGENAYCINLFDGGLFDEGYVLIFVFDSSNNRITRIYTHDH